MCSNLDKNVLAKYGAGVNMIALDKEIVKLESLGYKVVNSSGYGEGVYIVSVKMLHDLFGSVLLSVAQSEDDATYGYVRFDENNRLMNSYEFDTMPYSLAV